MKEFIEKLIGRLEERIFSAELYNDEFEGKTIDNLICLGDVTEIVNQLAEEYNNGWIPCSERLPEDGVEVLIYYRDKDEKYKDNDGIAVSEYREVTFGCRRMGYKDWYAPFEYFHQNYEVIAWQPLPAPYQPKGE